jgi:hypothetical protein
LADHVQTVQDTKLIVHALILLPAEEKGMTGWGPKGHPRTVLQAALLWKLNLLKLGTSKGEKKECLGLSTATAS